MIQRIIYLLFFALAFGGVIFEACFLLHAGINLLRRRKLARIYFSKAAFVSHGLMVIGLGCFLYGLYIEPYQLDVTFHQIETGKFAAGKIRIIQISDLHCDKQPHLEERLVREINALKPDILVFTGDATNPPYGMERFKTLLGQMQARLGKYAVRGNWDMIFPELFADTGFEEVNGRTLLIEDGGRRLRLTGLRFDNTGNVWKNLHKVPQEDFSLFLYHTPDLITWVKDLPVDLYLSGHTHGGQVCLPWYGAIVTFSAHGKAYESGLFKVGPVTLYVNRGVGMEGGYAPRVRFLARPELAVFDIVAK